MTEKRRRDEPQSGLPNGGPASNAKRALKSIVTVQASIPEDAFTAQTLGEQRSGSGVVIRESGLVLTIGYLITEAEHVWLADAEGRVTPAHALAIDAETGFGLVQALGELNCPALELGRSSEAKLGDPVTVGKQEFAGYWEYFLDEAIFTSPAHPFWGGAGAIDAEGRLVGIGSLHVEQLSEKGGPRDINMIVPIDLLPPIMDDLLTYGRVNKPARPWLGVFSAENGDEIIVASVAERGPAAEAGIRRGDVLAGVGGSEIESLGDFYRKVWSRGPAGVEIPLEIVRDGRAMGLRVRSADRSSFMKRPRLQ
jgi:S1-C subfamily serine protease